MALKDWLEEAWANVNPFDGGRTASTVVAERKTRTPATTPPQGLKSMPKAPYPVQTQPQSRATQVTLPTALTLNTQPQMPTVNQPQSPMQPKQNPLLSVPTVPVVSKQSQDQKAQALKDMPNPNKFDPAKLDVNKTPYQLGMVKTGTDNGKTVKSLIDEFHASKDGTKRENYLKTVREAANDANRSDHELAKYLLPQLETGEKRAYTDFTASNPQNKKIFGIEVGQHMGEFGKTYTPGTKVNENTASTYIAQFDKLRPEFQRYLVNKAKEQASAGDQAALNTLDTLQRYGRMDGDIMDLIEGSNERFLGAGARTIGRTADFVIPGENSLGLDDMANMGDAGRNGTRQFTDTGKAGEVVGESQKIAADVMSMIVPAVAAEKVIRGTKFVQGLNQGSKLARFGGYALSNAGGGLPATIVQAGQQIGNGEEAPDMAQATAIGVGTDLVAPPIIKGISKLAQYGSRAFTRPAAEAAEETIEEAIPNVIPRVPGAAIEEAAETGADAVRGFQENQYPINRAEGAPAGNVVEEAAESAPIQQTADDLSALERSKSYEEFQKNYIENTLNRTRQADGSLPDGSLGEAQKSMSNFEQLVKQKTGETPQEYYARRAAEAAEDPAVRIQDQKAAALDNIDEAGERAARDTRARAKESESDFEEFVNQRTEKIPLREGEKYSRFANRTVQASDEVSEPLKKLTRDEQVTYKATTNAEREAVAKKTIDAMDDGKAFGKVMNDLQDANRSDGGQGEFNAIELAKRLDGRTDSESLSMATEVLRKLSENATKRGQEIQALSYLQNRTPQGLKFGALRDLDKAGIKVTPEMKKEIDNLTKEIGKHPVGSDERNFAAYKLAQYVTSKVPVGIAPKIINFWRAGLLTAPTTTGGNILGNTGEAVVRKAFVNPASEVADYLMSKVTGKRSFAQAGGFTGGAKEGAGKVGRFVKTGYDERNALSKYDSGELNYGEGKVGTAVGKYVNGVYRLMSLADQPFWYGARNEALANLAKVEAMNKGLKGEAADKFMNELLDKPPKDLLEQATKEAKYATFQNETMLGTVAQFIKKGAEKYGGDKGRAVVDFFIPFTQVPASIATRVVQRTPVGTGVEIIKQIVNVKKNGKPFDQRAMAKAIGEGSFGSAVFAGGYALANSGMITFGFPEDQKERDLWEAEGKQPYSVRVGDRWYSLNYLQPFGTLLAIGGEAANAVKEGADPTETISRSVATAGQAVMNQSFLKGISGVLDAIDDPKRYAENYVENTAGSVVPNLVRSFARAADDKQRDVKGVWEGVVASLPGARSTLPAKQDMFGEDLAPKDNFLNQYINPLRPSKAKSDAVVAELRVLQDAGVGISPTSARKDTFEGTELTREQISEINKAAGIAMKGEYAKLMDSPEYKDMTPEQKSNSLSKINDTVFGAVKLAWAKDNGIETKSDLSKSQARYLEGQPVNFLSKLKSDGSTADSTDYAATLSREYKDTLSKYDLMTTDERDTWFNDEPDAEYKYKLAKAQNEMQGGKMSKADLQNTKTELAKAEVGSKFKKETRDLYGLSKEELWDLISTDPNGQGIADEVVAYGDALAEAGVSDKNKFRTKAGFISINPESTGGSGGGGRSGGKLSYKMDGYLDQVSNGKTLRQILAEAKVAGKTKKPY